MIRYITIFYFVKKLNNNYINNNDVYDIWLKYLLS